jgi:hypothetical protein
MKGLRTLLINGATVVGTAALTWAVGVDWTQYVSPTTAVIIVAAVNMGLRVITTTPVGMTK